MRGISRALPVALMLTVACRPIPTDPPDGPSTIYVATTGSDANSGSAGDDPLRTIGRALTLATPGDMILVLAGTYAEQVYVDSVGDPADPITIRGYGGRPVLDGQGWRRFGIQLDGGAGFVIENLEVTGYSDEGIAVWASSNVVVRDTVVHDNGFDNQHLGADGEGFGIDVSESQSVTIEGNDVFRNGPGPELRAQGKLGTGINTWGSIDLVIRDNHAHDNVGGGILVEDGTSVIVEGNLVERNDLDMSAWNWWDGAIWIDGGGDVAVRGNEFRDNLGPGIEITDEEGASPTGYVLEGNVSTGNYFGIYLYGLGTCPFPSETMLVLSGNTFTGNTRRDILCELG